MGVQLGETVHRPSLTAEGYETLGAVRVSDLGPGLSGAGVLVGLAALVVAAGGGSAAAAFFMVLAAMLAYLCGVALLPRHGGVPLLRCAALAGPVGAAGLAVALPLVIRGGSIGTFEQALLLGATALLLLGHAGAQVLQAGAGERLGGYAFAAILAGWPLVLVFIGLVVLPAGVMLFAVGVAQSRVLPRGAGWTMLAAAVVWVAGASLFGANATFAFGVVFTAGWAWLGLGLWRVASAPADDGPALAQEAHAQ
jgi:hypothetical protein